MAKSNHLKNESNMMLLYCPCSSEDEASRLASALLERRLIACANIHPSRSLYRWQGAIQDETEHVLLCKTAASRALEVEQALREMHSYELPCILTLQPVRVNSDYAAWVMDEVG